MLLPVSTPGALACTVVNAPPPADPAEVFTPARPDAASAVRDFFGMRPPAVQPIEFPHNVHVAQGLTCTDYCHESATKGPVAGLPSIKTCMICHAAIATDRPRIQELAALEAKGLDLAWQRVYGYTNEAHVASITRRIFARRSNARPATARSAEQTVARRNVDLTMGFCVDCHTERKASNDCLTCHY